MEVAASASHTAASLAGCAIDFVAGTKNRNKYRQDPSFIYRCENLKAPLEAQGIQVGLYHVAEYQPRAGVAAVVLHRPRRSLALAWLVLRLRRRGVAVLADVDDLIFDEDLACFSPAVQTGQHSLHKIRRQFAQNRAALQWADHIVVSTAALREHVRRVFPGKATSLAHNSVHNSWAQRRPLPRGCGQSRVVTYCPGTRSHDHDFAPLEPVLKQLLHRHPEVQLRITGPLQHSVPVDKRRVIHRAKLPFEEYWKVFEGAWLNLAPLQANPFNACKSALKVLEAGYWNVPTLCSPNPDAERFVGAGALTAAAPQEVEKLLESLFSPSTYQAHVLQLRERCQQRACSTHQARVLLRAVSCARARP